MSLEQILKKEYLNDDLQAKNKTEALNELSEIAIKGSLKLNKRQVYDALLQREKLGSTGIGDGVAIPHGKISNLEQVIVAFGRSKNGVAFDSIDGKPVHIFFLLLAPENSTSHHLRTLAKVCRMLKTANFRKRLMAAESNNDFYEIIIEENKKHPDS
ncbi:MAG: PTS sugar transporter subunit IIA [Smithella sp.]